MPLAQGLLVINMPKKAKVMVRLKCLDDNMRLNIECKQGDTKEIKLRGHKSILLSLYYTTFARQKYLIFEELSTISN